MTTGAAAVGGASVGLIGGPAGAVVDALIGAAIWEGMSIYRGIG